jgi:hypothetical protein
VSIVMGLDQHRAQITADWLDSETGEVKRARVAPAAIEISDDGVGGATGRVDPACGLTNRVEALHGLLLVTCPPGEGTVATAELLCAVAKR